MEMPGQPIGNLMPGDMGQRVAVQQQQGRAVTAMPQVKPYIAMLGERPAFRRVTEDRKAAQAAMKK